MEIELEELERTHKLTAKQEKFCQEYILCLNGTLAYQKAYDSEYETAHKNAYRLMANNGIKARIKELQEKMAEEYDVKKEFLMMNAIWVINKAKEGKAQVVLSRTGEVVETGKVEYDMRAINDAIRNLSAITGLNLQKVKADVDADVKAKVTASSIAKELMSSD